MDNTTAIAITIVGYLTLMTLLSVLFAVFIMEVIIPIITATFI